MGGDAVSATRAGRGGTPTADAGERPMTYRDIAPNFRCVTDATGKTCVEIPTRYAEQMWPPADTTNPDALAVRAEARRRVDEMINAHRPALIFDELLAAKYDDHRAATSGVLVPVEVWDRVMNEEVPGWVWRRIERGGAGA